MSMISLLMLISMFPQPHGQPCLDSTPATRKHFYHLGREKEVAISTTRGESRIIASVFKIFVEEVLGYQTKLFFMDEKNLTFDFSSQFSRLTTCRDPLCNRIDPQYEPDTPQAMITLDMWLPPSQEVDSWGLLEAGQLGPAVRFGFLSPNAAQTEPLQGWNHWKVFKSRENLNKLILTDKQLQFVTEHTIDKNQNSFCPDPFCTAGMFTPPQCQGGNISCAVIIASYTGTTAMYNTSMIVQFITANNLLLKIVFVGPNLEKVVDYMASSTKVTGNSYVVLHYYPSILTSRYKLQPMLVPLCQDPLLQHDRSNPACFFNVNRLSKVVWMPVQKEAPKLYNFIQHFSFRYKEYSELMDLYNSEIVKKPSDIDSDIQTEVACAWLKGEHWWKTIMQKREI